MHSTRTPAMRADGAVVSQLRAAVAGQVITADDAG